MIIEQAGSHDEVLRAFRAYSRTELIAQSLVQRGAVDVVEFILKHGATKETCEEILDSLKFNTVTLHEIANERGVQLPSYQAP